MFFAVIFVGGWVLLHLKLYFSYQMKKTVLALCIIPLCISVFSQSSSVFDANYFNKDGSIPPIKTGKGFYITDVYKQTKHCFIPSSCSMDKLKPTGSSQKTTFSIHYTETDEEYNTLQNHGGSGKISYLNLFSLGGSKLESFATKSYDEKTRVTFIAKVDFGLYTYEEDPELNSDAKELITQGKYDDFIDLYGSHFINGVRLQNSIWVTLTESNTRHSDTKSNSNSLGVGVKIPARGKIGFEVNENSEVESIIESSEFEVLVEINGPKMQQSSLQKSIESVLERKSSEDKVTAIKNFILAAMENISNPDQAAISHYYYSPFSLYQVKGVNWNEKKENQLVKINENVIDVYSAKSVVDNLCSSTGINYLIEDFNNELYGFEFSKRDFFKNELVKAYNKSLPVLKNYKYQLDTTLTFLEKLYIRCSDIHCSTETNCCGNENFIENIKSLTLKIDNEIGKIDAVEDKAIRAAIEELPECLRENVSFVTVENKSTNPYDFYEEDTFISTIPGGAVVTYKLSLGNHFFKATQKTGYLMYPTVNNRKVIAEQACSEYRIKIGFED